MKGEERKHNVGDWTVNYHHKKAIKNIAML
jgi:hypothetical protein